MERPHEASGREAAVTIAGLVLALLRTVSAPARFLIDWPEEDRVRDAAPGSLPVLAWLGASVNLSSPTTSRLTRALGDYSGRLPWKQSYAASDFGAAFLERYGWAQLLGDRGLIESALLACGFLLLGPDTDYPPHAHEAEELYIPLAGTALWQGGTGKFEARAPGTVIHHPPWMPHAMRTQEQPLLAMYLWRGGDLAASPAIVGPA